jgi:hypothetical protein
MLVLYFFGLLLIRQLHSTVQQTHGLAVMAFNALTLHSNATVLLTVRTARTKEPFAVNTNLLEKVINLFFYC